jgi:hypothetical protein
MVKFIDFDSTDPKILQRSKNAVIIIGVSMLVIVIIFSIFASEKNKKKIKTSTLSNTTKNKIDIASSMNVNVEDEWLNKSENDLKILQEQNKTLLKRLDMLEEERKKDKENYANVMNSLAVEMAHLRNTRYTENDNSQQYNEYGESILKGNNIESINIELDNNTGIEGSNYNDLEDYIPAGSYATAKMLSGADVSTGVNAQSDPNNMMFEITSPVVVPKYKGKAQEIKKIEGCRIMGAAVGQLWTEKAYIRLLKMSCSFEKGKVAEYNVKGYVTSFAKEGVRGKIVSREGYFTSMAFLAGAVEGIANVAKSAYAPTMELSTGIATQSVNLGDATRQAGASGFGKAAEMLSDYYIKRAEQYQSVVDVPTGITVEIVFQEGVDLSKNIGFKIKPNELGKTLGTQAGQDMNTYSSSGDF